jgi:diadenosine tetraphosphate (Ap4A) HIT family hydrolase
MANPARRLGGDRQSMARKKRLKIWQIWHVEFTRPASLRTDGDRRCYQIIARLVRDRKNHWVAVDTTANPPTRASFAVFDDYGREVEPAKAKARALSRRCLDKCLFKTHSLEINMRQDSDLFSESYDDRAKGCRFCQVIAVRMVGFNALSYAIRDGNPVTPLHTLIIPQRHVESFFDLRGGERNAIFALLDEMKADIQHKDDTVEGFNIGVNNGEVAGQSVPHVHVHLIPRRRGDVENPRGGVRGVIPRKAIY